MKYVFHVSSCTCWYSFCIQYIVLLPKLSFVDFRGLHVVIFKTYIREITLIIIWSILREIAMTLVKFIFNYIRD